MNAFNIQANNALLHKKNGNLFFAKASSGYFVDYFTKASMTNFMEMYFASLEKLNYFSMLSDHINNQ